MKNDQDKTGSNQNKGSGSDTASAAKISAGTSVGNVGESPMPQAQGSQGRMGTSAGSGPSAQSPTYASNTSKPLGGAGPMRVCLAAKTSLAAFVRVSWSVAEEGRHNGSRRPTAGYPALAY